MNYRRIWEACLDGHVLLNGEQVIKKSANVRTCVHIIMPLTVCKST